MKLLKILIALIFLSTTAYVSADEQSTPQPLNINPTIIIPNRSSDDFWKQQYLENQRQQQILEQQRLELEKKKFKYEQQQVLQQKRQERIAQLQQMCIQKPVEQMSLSERSLCNALENNIKYGSPLTDEQLGIKMWKPTVPNF